MRCLRSDWTIISEAGGFGDCDRRIDLPAAAKGLIQRDEIDANGAVLQKMPSLTSLDGLTTRPLKESGPDLVLEARAIWRSGEMPPLVSNFVEVLRKICPTPSSG